MTVAMSEEGTAPLPTLPGGGRRGALPAARTRRGDGRGTRDAGAAACCPTPCSSPR